MSQRRVETEKGRIDLNREMKTYSEWTKLFMEESNCRIIDDDGARSLYRNGRFNELITADEAYHLFIGCTMEWNALDL